MRIHTLVVFVITGLLAAFAGNLTADEEPALAIVEGRNTVLRVATEDLEHLEDPQQWVAKLDRAYEALADLVGRRPFNGAKIAIEAVEENPGGWVTPWWDCCSARR